MSTRLPSADHVRQLYGGRLRPGEVAEALRNSHTWFPVATVRRGGPVQRLDRGPALAELTIRCGGRDYDLVDYLAVNRVSGLLIVHRGRVVREDYELGLTPYARHASFSLAKSVCSTLIGCALVDGHIESLDTHLGEWLPALRGTAYEAVSLRALLGMRTGIAWNETYTDPDSDRRRFLEAQLSGQPGALMAVMSQLRQRQPTDRAFNYSTGETFLVGAVLEAATGRSLAQYLSDALWGPLGMEHDAFWWQASAHGVGMGGSGLSATLRDYGRFAQFVLDGGVLAGCPRVPTDWFAQSTQRPTDGAHYGYQWWLPPSDDPRQAGAFLGMGIFGQRMYIHPQRRLAAVVLAARSKPSDSHVIPDEAFFGALAEVLA